MKIYTPRDQGFNGGCGGVGSKPAPAVWTPGTKSSRARKHAPGRFRHVRLRRTKRPRMESLSTAGVVAMTAVVLGLAYLFFKMLGG